MPVLLLLGLAGLALAAPEVGSLSSADGRVHVVVVERYPGGAQVRIHHKEIRLTERPATVDGVVVGSWLDEWGVRAVLFEGTDGRVWYLAPEYREVSAEDVPASLPRMEPRHRDGGGTPRFPR